MNKEQMMVPGIPEYPPCQAGCPIHQDIQEYVRQISIGDYDKSLEVILRTNPLPSMCGTICAHPCETECRRKDVDQAVSIRALKRFAVENGKWPEAKEVPVTRPEKVAVIGAGPAGLTAAKDLAEMGFAVTVFDREPVAGGAVAHYIPRYRMPMSYLEHDVERLKAMGIEFRLGVELGQQLVMRNLTLQYNAVILAMGLPKSRGLNIPGADAKDVMYALPFLKDAKYNDFKFPPGRKVIVVGGGNVAMDVARTALRCGAESVQLVCLECREEMPAFEWEIEEAVEEGVVMHPSWGPKEILVDESGNITGMKVQECLCVFDENRRFNPKFGESTTVLEGNTVILAIGQSTDDLSYMQERWGIDLNERGQILFNPRTMQTTRSQVFVAGELAFGPGAAVKAMASGRLTAMAVRAFLDKVPFDATTFDLYQTLKPLSPEVAEKVKRIERVKVPMLSPETRVKSNDHVEVGYDERLALCESRRCMDCAAGAQVRDELCAVCLTCLRTCPYGVPHIDENGIFTIRNEECQACGLCVGICPARAIRFRNSYVQFALDRMKDAVEQAAKSGAGPATLVFCCSYGAFAERKFQEYIGNGKPANLAVVRVPCVAKVEVANILEAFNLGAEAVFVAGCEQEEECTYHDVSKWAGKRVGRVKEILSELGLEPDRVEHLNLAPEQVRNFSQVADDFLAKVKAVLDNAGGGEQ